MGTLRVPCAVPHAGDSARLHMGTLRVRVRERCERQCAELRQVGPAIALGLRSWRGALP